VVLFEPLFQVMDRDEIMFIIGHEMGHVRLGHTWLNSLVGGMAGIPASIGAALILVLALRSWNKACEFSADRAGLLACANPVKAVSALIKLEAGPAALNPANMQAIMARIEAQDDNWMNNLGELFTTHPMIVKRIQALRKYARSEEYQRLQAGMNGNL
jgi:Zn-dependent protease with chaperone function